ncbi:hypothetical protein NQZ68_036964 [Dissostichus eleginoides]|nr:hypothetical protein NQZ68_036964 [Dissostichus eleginoides]
MSSGGMHGWIVVHGEQTRRAKREEEECRAPENTEGEHVVPLSQTTVPCFALHVPAAGRCIFSGGLYACTVCAVPGSSRSHG